MYKINLQALITSKIKAGQTEIQSVRPMFCFLYLFLFCFYLWRKYITIM
ncbi:hypothetical protein AQPE_1899 [Aquipluma nitroreducens]|uniref:Uncharacterized protein n=1 Tax=Aquipluma nitroreducens TaxID=2010828 RepID=A0A5K7S865_9BACT|nr:hypothetical protein AQPE_1899 [Aquipluma nitroreducens]